MGNFHRFVDPSYYLFSGESFPASPGGTGLVGTHTYDRANVTSGGMGGPGGAANVDNQKASGPNQYTYFVAFNEDGTSSNTNRGMRALAQNTDVLDDILRTSVPKYATASLPAPGLDYVTLSGDVFVGDSIMPASALVALSDPVTGHRLYNGVLPVSVTDIDNGTPGSSVIGTGWATNPTIRFNTTVSTALLVTYGARTSNARIVEREREALWRMFVQGLDTAVNAKSLESHGFNEMYRRATALSLISVGAAPDTPGSGAIIIRDGQALEVQEPDQDYTIGTGRPDPYLALFKATKNGVLGSRSVAKSGAIGFLELTTRGLVYNDGDPARSYAGFARLMRRNVDADTAGGGAIFTRVPLGAGALLNPSGTGSTRLALATSGHRFRTGGKTAVRLGVDLLLITRTSGERQLATITGFINDTTVTTSLVTGSTAYPANEAVTVEWVQPVLVIGDGTDGSLGGFRYYPQPILGESATAAPGGKQAKLVASSRYRYAIPLGSDGRENLALTWGGFDENTGLEDMRGELRGDGGAVAQYFKGAHVNAPVSATVSGASYTFNFHPVGEEGVAPSSDALHLRVTAAGLTTITINMNDSVVPLEGSRITVTMHVLNTAEVSLVWSGSYAQGGSGFLFSGGDSQIPAYTEGWYKWEGILVLDNGVCTCLMTRTDY